MPFYPHTYIFIGCFLGEHSCPLDSVRMIDADFLGGQIPFLLCDTNQENQLLCLCFFFGLVAPMII